MTTPALVSCSVTFDFFSAYNKHLYYIGKALIGHIRLHSFLSDVMDDRVETLIFPSCSVSRGLACLRKHL